VLHFELTVPLLFRGRVKLAIYKVYLKAASYTLMAIAVVLVLVHYVGDVAQKFWIGCKDFVAAIVFFFFY
jgi:hypothetical protein